MSAQAHNDTIGLDATNDRLAESVFGTYDYILRRCPGISMEAASAVAQAIRSKSFAANGQFTKLPRKEQIALVELARTTVREMRAVDRADHAEHHTYVELKRKSNSQLELDALVKQYALALSFYKRWKSRGVKDAATMRAALAALATSAAVMAIADATARKRKAAQLQLDYLREQIEMRVIGLGFVEFTPAWSSSKDEEIGTVEDLTTLLKEILMEECERDCCGDLPDAAVVPVMKRKQFKQLGDPTNQATELATTIKALSGDELLALAQRKRVQLEEAGEIDEVGDEQQEEAPTLDDSMVGTELEVCWRYWRPPTDEEKAAGEKRKKIGEKIWCEGKVEQVANGTTDKESVRCKNLLKAGALRIRWPADPVRKEPETLSWHVFQDADWNQDAHLGWRFTAATLKVRTEAAAAAERPPKRRK